MPRIARIVVVGYPHHVIQRGNNRRRIFFYDKDREFYLKLLSKYSLECGCKIHAYCLMSNHVHILVVPQYDYSLAKTMQKLSLRFTQYINKKYKKTGRLWECRFHSTLVDKEAYLWSVCRYIERNPVRAKIVSEPSQYKWSSVKINTMGQKGSFVEPIWQSHSERKEYFDFLNRENNKEEVERIRKSTFSGKPIGTEKFLNQRVKTLGININIRSRGRPRKNKKGVSLNRMYP